MNTEKNPFSFTPVRAGIGYTNIEVNIKNLTSGVMNVPMPVFMDADVGAKVYKTPHTIEIINNLSNNGIRLFNYILFHLGKEKEYIKLLQDKVCQEIKIGRNSYYNAIKELSSSGIINSKPGANMYWINIHILFNGNRAKYVKDKYGEDHINVIFKGKIQE